ncbi:fimbria/pilus outer membrane usher protein [Pseudomonas palleroniana]|uniref:fimbria/pilus outer membrane usher protein n=1 Tax=Pseudomonas palleroniana TaxID=191390 RepID=UPI003AFFAC0F
MRYVSCFVKVGLPLCSDRINRLSFGYAKAYACLMLVIYGGLAQGSQYFDPAFLTDTKSKVADLSRFEKVDAVLPGTYRVDVYLNGVFINTRDVLFEPNTQLNEGATALAACFTQQEIIDFNINPAAVVGLDSVAPGSCIQLETLISQAQSTLNLEQLRLDLSVPQAMLIFQARGLVPVDEWDNGVNALLVNYNFTGAHTRDSNTTGKDNYFLNLNTGLNVGAWRLRNNSTVSEGNRYNSGGGVNWTTLNSYVQRALPEIKGSLVLGQATTSTTVFNNFGFDGVRLFSDDSMLADSERGFAPVVRGIAGSNAEVTIRQSGNVIYQTYVAAGPFTINDLYPSSTNGDLQVSVTEADGRVNEYSVPFASLPIMQREGQLKYDVVVGTLRGNSYQESPSIVQGTLAWGLPAGLTLYGGLQNAEKYQSYSLGVGQNLGHWGAVSFDVTAANSMLPDHSEHTGYSLRMLYAKTLAISGTNFKLAGYQYSTRGFYNFTDTASKMMERNPIIIAQDGEIYQNPDFADRFNLNYPKRSSVQLNISQPLGGMGSLYVGGNRQTFWNTKEVTDLLQAGYQNTIKGVNYSLSYNYNNGAWLDKPDRIVAFNISMPLGDGAWSGKRNSRSRGMYATYGQTVNDEGHTRYNAGVSGTALENNNFSYGMQQSYNDQSHAASSNLSGIYRGPTGNASAAYSYSKENSRLNYGLSGGVVAHADGVTFSQPLGDTNILVKAPLARDVKIANSVGIKTNRQGYAVIPSGMNYRQNRVALDTNSLANNIEIDDPVTYVVPTQGALVRSTFNVRIGVRALMNIFYKGAPVPFGASVTQLDHSNDNIVGTNGQVFLSGLALEGRLNVRWSDGPEGQCTVDYQLDEGSEYKDISKLDAECL